MDLEVFQMIEIYGIRFWRSGCKKKETNNRNLQFTKNIPTTLPETNIAPARRPSQKETNIATIHFRVLC